MTPENANACRVATQTGVQDFNHRNPTKSTAECKEPFGFCAGCGRRVTRYNLGRTHAGNRLVVWCRLCAAADQQGSLALEGGGHDSCR